MNESADLFGQEPAQASLFGESDDRIPFAATVSHIPSLDDVRRRMHALLSQVRTADRMPWDLRRAKTYQTIFPQMANWLPEDEANQLCFEFMQEIERLLKAA